MYSAVKATSILARMQPSLVRTHRLFASVPILNATAAPRTQTRHMSATATATQTLHEQNIEPAEDSGASRHFSKLRFQDAPLSDATKRGMKHEYLSDVQEAVLEPGLAGEDLLVQAKTGTGKTLAFLLPTIERLAKGPQPNQRKISVLVLSPTRELALQIETEARTLLKNHPYKVQHAIGGTNVGMERRSITGQQCDILVATPGRLMDHMQSGPLREMLSEVKTLIFDEADRLLDAGFKVELEKIVKMLPDTKVVPRQTLLFSATVSEDIKKVTSFALRKDHKFVSTLLEGEANAHEHVEQSAVVTPMGSTWAAMLAILREDALMHPGKSKVMVFFTTAKGTGLAGESFRFINGLSPVLTIHSRKTQQQRTRAADDFKRAKSAILMSSDVAARGMDFPGVTLVLQVGLPSNSEQYIHRLGRTARAGASGRGVLVLSPMEAPFLRDRSVQALGIKPHTAVLDLEAASADVQGAMERIPESDKSDAYAAWLGYYKGAVSRYNVSPQSLVDTANEFALGVTHYKGSEGLPPRIGTSLATKMGLKGARGLNHHVGGHFERKPDPSANQWSGGFARRSAPSYPRTPYGGSRGEGSSEGGRYGSRPTYESRPQYESRPRYSGGDPSGERRTYGSGDYSGGRGSRGGYSGASQAGTGGGYSRNNDSFRESY